MTRQSSGTPAPSQRVKNAGVITGILVALAGIAWLDPGYQHPSAVEFLDPAPGEAVELTLGEPITLVGESIRAAGCRLEAAGQSIEIGDGAFRCDFESPLTPGQHLLWIDALCEDGPRWRFARRLTVSRDRPPARAEVLRIHLNTAEFEQQISERLPEELNAAMPEWIPQLRRRVDWYPAFYLGSGTAARVLGARVDLEESGSLRLSVDMDVTLDIRWPFGSRVLQGPVQIEGVIHIGSDRRPVLVGTPRIELQGLCGSLPRLVRNYCPNMADLMEELSRPLLAESLNDELGRWARTFDLESEAREMILGWAREAELENEIETFLEGSRLEIDRTSFGGSAGGFVASVFVARSWLGQDSADLGTAEGSEAPIDIWVSTALLNRLLAMVFDRPLPQALSELRGFAKASGSDQQLDAFIARLEALEHSSGSLPEGLQALLKTTDLKYNPEAVFEPQLSITSEGKLAVAVLGVPLFEGGNEPDHVAMALSAETTFSLQAVQGEIKIVADQGRILRYFSMEPTSTNAERLDREILLRYASLQRFFIEQIERYQTTEVSLIDPEALEETLSPIPQLASRFKFADADVIISHLTGDPENQVLAIGGSISGL